MHGSRRLPGASRTNDSARSVGEERGAPQAPPNDVPTVKSLESEGSGDLSDLTEPSKSATSLSCAHPGVRERSAEPLGGASGERQHRSTHLAVRTTGPSPASRYRMVNRRRRRIARRSAGGWTACRSRRGSPLGQSDILRNRDDLLADQLQACEHRLVWQKATVPSDTSSDHPERVMDVLDATEDRLGAAAGPITIGGAIEGSSARASARRRAPHRFGPSSS